MHMNLSSMGKPDFFKATKIDAGMPGNAIRLSIDNVSISEGVIDGSFCIKFHTKMSGYVHRPCDSIDINPSYQKAAMELVELFKQSAVIQADEPVDFVLDSMQSRGDIEDKSTGVARLKINLGLNDISCNFSEANEGDRLNAISCFHDKFPSIHIMEERPSDTCCIS